MALYVFLVLLMSNLGAMVDLVLHPEIPYFDDEHLMVGGITAITVILLLGALETYLARRGKIEADAAGERGTVPPCCSRHTSSGFAMRRDRSWTTHGKPRDYRFLEVNPAFTRLTGRKAEDLIGRTVLEVDARYRAVLDRSPTGASP